MSDRQKFMSHTIIIKKLSKKLVPSPDMLPFYIVRQEKITLMKDGILCPTNVGIRYVGFFSFHTIDNSKHSNDEALEALKYGLMTAQFHLTSPTELEIAPLFKKKREAFVSEANKALEESASSYRLEEVIFSYVDLYIHENKTSPVTQQYSGFILGQFGMRNVVVHAPQKIPGEWQCVCGAYNAPGNVCEVCGIKKPTL